MTLYLITTAIISIFFWEILRAFIKWMRPDPIKHYEPARHEYPKKDWSKEEFIDISKGRKLPNPDYIPPKKDCECDCLGECKTITTGGGLPPETYFHNECQGNVPLEQYMSRHNRRYFRGDNIKVVVTVKGGK